MSTKAPLAAHRALTQPLTQAYLPIFVKYLPKCLNPVNAVINLADSLLMYAGAVVTPVFQEVRDGKARTISFLAKKARGLMTRFVIQERLNEPSGLKRFDVAGYRYQPDASTDTKWVFQRPYPS